MIEKEYKWQITHTEKRALMPTYLNAGVTAQQMTRDKAIELLCEHLKVTIVKTNYTKHGNVELVLVKDEDL